MARWKQDLADEFAWAMPISLLNDMRRSQQSNLNRARGIHTDAMTGLVYKWPNDHRKVKLARQRAREQNRELEFFVSSSVLVENMKEYPGCGQKRAALTIISHYSRSVICAHEFWRNHPCIYLYSAVYVQKNNDAKFNRIRSIIPTVAKQAALRRSGLSDGGSIWRANVFVPALVSAA